MGHNKKAHGKLKGRTRGSMALVKPKSVKKKKSGQDGTNETVVIKDGKVTLYRRKSDGKRMTVKTVTAESVCREFSRHAQEAMGVLQTPFLPIGSRYYFRRGHAEVLVVEHPPQVRTVYWSEATQFHSSNYPTFDTPSNIPNYFYPPPLSKKDSEKKRRVTLAFPYVILVLTFIDGVPKFELDKTPLVFYRNSPLRFGDEALFHTNLHNVRSTNNWVCLGSAVNSILADVRRMENFCDLAEEIIKALWSTGFNINISVRNKNSIPDDFDVARNMDKRISSISAWQKETGRDPLFMLTVPWKRSTAHPTIKEAVGDLLDTYCGVHKSIAHPDIIDFVYRAREGKTRGSVPRGTKDDGAGHTESLSPRQQQTVQNVVPMTQSQYEEHFEPEGGFGYAS